MTRCGKQNLLAIITTVAVALAVCAGYVWHLARIEESLTPPPNVIDLRSFGAHMPLPQRGYELQVDGARYTELVGPLPPSSSLPSGPPTYIFDSDGGLVDWYPDCDEDTRYDQRWRPYRKRRLADDELENLIGAE